MPHRFPSPSSPTLAAKMTRFDTNTDRPLSLLLIQQDDLIQQNRAQRGNNNIASNLETGTLPTPFKEQAGMAVVRLNSERT